MVNDDQLANFDGHAPSDDDTTSFAQLSGDQLARLATMVSTGEEPLPLNLPVEQLSSLLAEVGCIRRKRLIRLIALAIAHDILGDRELKEMGE